MKQRTSTYLFALFALFVIFADELFYGFVSLTGAGLESGMKSREAILIAAIAYILLLGDMLNNRLRQRNYLQLIVMALLLASYYVTHYFYPYSENSSKYTAHLLVFGSLCIPSCYVGMRLAKGKSNEDVLRYLPFFVIFVSVIVAVATVTTSMVGAILNSDEDVFNYQSASYYLSYCFSYSVFYVFLYKDKQRTSLSKIETLGMLLMLFVCAIGCLLGGGRGAFVYMVLISAFLFYRVMKQKGRIKVGSIFLLLLAAGALLLLATRLHVFDSTGFVRVTENLTNDDNREELWDKAIASFKDSPIIGHGIGSVWWEVGYYSHNMLSDFLVETGIIGTTLFIFVIIKMLLRLYRLSKHSSFDLFILLVILGAMVEYTFSGYWFSAPKLFLAFGYVYGLDSNKRRVYN